MSAAVENLLRWRDDGTLRRISDATDRRTPVQIKRSSGKMQSAVIVSCAGFGGLMCVVAWGPDVDQAYHDVGADRVHFPPGVEGKQVDTADLIEWNPWLASGGAS